MFIDFRKGEGRVRERNIDQLLSVCTPYWGSNLLLQSRGQGVVHDKLLQKGFPLSVSGGSFPHAHLPGSQCPLPEERRLSMPKTGEKERNCLFKSYTNLRVMT